MDSIRSFRLDPGRITSREVLFPYLREMFAGSWIFPEDFSGNLDALADILSELCEDTEIRITRSCMKKVTEDHYSWQVFRVLADSAAKNPHLNLLFL